MFSFKAIIQKFSSKGEKSGWTYVEIPTDVLARLKRKDKKSFRIKGTINDVRFEKLSTYPVGNAEMIIALNGQMRKLLGKKEGAEVSVKFDPDENANPFSKELMDCLHGDKPALEQFMLQPLSHQNYFHNYIESAKTQVTKASRIVNTLNAMYKKQNFGEMIRGLKVK